MKKLGVLTPVVVLLLATAPLARADALVTLEGRIQGPSVDAGFVVTLEGLDMPVVAVSDTAGRFTMSAPPGTYVLRWQPPAHTGLRAGSQPIELSADRSLLLLFAPPTVDVAGRVVDGAGRSLPGPVRFSQGGDSVTDWTGRGPDEDPHGLSLPDGRFHVATPPGRQYVEVTSWPRAADQPSVIAGVGAVDVVESTELDIEIPTDEVTVRVVDEAGQPVAGAFVVAFDWAGDVPVSAFDSSQWLSVDAATADEAGVARLALPRSARWLTIQAFAPGQRVAFPLWWGGSENPPDDEGQPVHDGATIDVTLTGASPTLSGRVDDSHDVGIAGARVFFDAGEYAAATITDADGRYDVSLPPTDLLENIRLSRFGDDLDLFLVSEDVPVDMTGGVGTLDLTVPVEDRTVSVVDGGAPVAGAEVQLHSRGQGDGIVLGPGVTTLIARSTGRGTTDNDGRTTVGALPLAGQRVVAVDRGPGTMTIVEAEFDEQSVPLTVDLAAEPLETVTLESRDRSGAAVPLEFVLTYSLTTAIRGEIDHTGELAVSSVPGSFGISWTTVEKAVGHQVHEVVQLFRDQSSVVTLQPPPVADLSIVADASGGATAAAIGLELHEEWWRDDRRAVAYRSVVTGTRGAALDVNSYVGADRKDGAVWLRTVEGPLYEFRLWPYLEDVQEVWLVMQPGDAEPLLDLPPLPLPTAGDLLARPVPGRVHPDDLRRPFTVQDALDEYLARAG